MNATTPPGQGPNTREILRLDVGTSVTSLGAPDIPVTTDLRGQFFDSSRLPVLLSAALRVVKYKVSETPQFDAMILSVSSISGGAACPAPNYGL